MNCIMLLSFIAFASIFSLQGMQEKDCAQPQAASIVATLTGKTLEC